MRSLALHRFYLNPNEYEPLESNTRLLGGNVPFSPTTRIHADATVMCVVNSNTRYFVRGSCFTALQLATANPAE